jgi:PAS domain S-box-containing protein
MTPRIPHRWLVHGLLLASLVLAPLAGRAATGPERVVLQLSYTHQFQFAGVYAAISQGYFREHNLEVEMRTGSSQRLPSGEVESGRAQYGIGPSGVLTDRLNGSPFVALAAIFQHSPFVLMARLDSRIATPSDLVGRRIALIETSRYTEMLAMLKMEGLRSEQFTTVPDRESRNELLTGDADVTATYITDGPYEVTRHGLEYRLIRPADYGVDFYGDFLFTSETELRNHPGRALAMRQAVVQGWEYALAHRAELVDWILTQLPEKDRSPGRTRDWLQYEAEATARLINADLVEIGHMNPGRWQRMAELTVAIGQAKSTDRLAGFVYSPEPAVAPRWWRWLLGSLGIAVLVALSMILANRRLQSLVRRRTQELAVSEQRQRDYFDLAPAPIVIEDYTALEPVLARYRAEGITDLRAHLRAHPKLARELLLQKRIVAANRLALVRTGYTSVADMDRNAPEIMTEQSMQMFIEELVAISENRDRLTLEKTYHTKLGETIHTLVNWEIGRKDGKRDLSSVQLVFTDVTQQKQTELALRQSEERYRQHFEHAVGGIYRSSPEGQFLAVNPAMARLFGFDRPEQMIVWTQQSPAHSLYVKPARREEFVALIGQRGEVHDFESEVRGKEGASRWISENARAVQDEKGNLLYYEGFVTDITARRQLESEMARASKLEAVGILAGGIAHDFNNILTVVLGNVTLLELDTPAGSPQAARLADAKRATLRARDLTLQLLTFAKGGEPVKSAIELPELIKESAGFALHGAKARADFRIARGLWRVNADKGQLGQVVQNLVINAVQAMPGGGQVTITADNTDTLEEMVDLPPLPQGRYVRISVADSGTGIAREHLAKIFDPYFTTKEQGSGLGLATAYSIIRKHAGHIMAESEPGRGTTFRLWLPAEAAASSGAAPGATGSRSPFRARVLFMDDETAIRAMAAIFMERIGYDCEVAVDGAEAVRKYGEAMAAGRKYEVVIMDLTVPGGMGGREAMERLVRLDPSVCAIVSSGYSRDPVMANYRAYGFQGILPKPYGLDQLTKVMSAVLDGAANPT